MPFPACCRNQLSPFFFFNDTATTELYTLSLHDALPIPTVGLVLAALIGIAATAIAVRWDSVIVAAIGIVGALLAPVLVDSGTSNASLAFMALALCAAVGVLISRCWTWP